MPLVFNGTNQSAMEKRLNEIAIKVANAYLPIDNLRVAMATVFNQDGYKFVFPSADALNELLHVHVKKDGKSAKFWVKDEKFGKKDIADSEWQHDCKLARNDGLKPEQINEVACIIENRRDEIVSKWSSEKAKGDNAGKIPGSNPTPYSNPNQ